MTLLDLSGAEGLRVANVDALALRIANVDVWEAAGVPSRTQHSVFGDTVPGVLTQHDDGLLNWWLQQQFYAASVEGRAPLPAGSTIDAVRFYVAPGSPMIGTSGEVSIDRLTEPAPQFFAANAGGDRSQIGNMALTGALTPTGVLAAGWNRIPLLGGPWAWPGSDLGVVAGIRFNNTRYQYNSTVPAIAIQAASGVNLFLAESAMRAFYDGGNSDARWYGLDLEIGVPA